MLRSLQDVIRQMPPLLLGFLIIALFVVFYRYYDPPVTFCQVQMEAVQERLAVGFYKNPDRAHYDQAVNAAFDFCLSTNSAGGCLDMFSRLDYFEKQIRTLPSSCGSDVATEPVRKALEKGIRLFAMIAWGDEPPKNKYVITAWLDPRDLGIYCRLKSQYQRLYGRERWNALAWAIVPGLPGVDQLPAKDRSERALFAFPCKGLL